MSFRTHQIADDCDLSLLRGFQRLLKRNEPKFKNLVKTRAGRGYWISQSSYQTSPSPPRLCWAAGGCLLSDPFQSLWTFMLSARAAVPLSSRLTHAKCKTTVTWSCPCFPPPAPLLLLLFIKTHLCSVQTAISISPAAFSSNRFHGLTWHFFKKNFQSNKAQRVMPAELWYPVMTWGWRWISQC